MNTNPGSGFWMILLVLCSLNAPVTATDATSETNVPAEPACEKEIRAGSRIPVLVCTGDETDLQSLQGSELILHPRDLAYILSKQFPELTVQMGSRSGVNVQQ